MCNLNILINLKNKPILNCSFLSGATAVSFYDNNSNGDGIYFDNGIIIRSKDKLNLFNYLNSFKSSKLMITHQRYSTSGKTEKYTQPFESPNFIMAHNGVLRSYEEGDKSDTFVVFNEFLRLFNKSKAKRETRIIKVIEELFKDEHGTWSVSLFDKETKTLYYFKDNATKISCYLNETKDIMFLSTKDDNGIFLHIFNEDFIDMEIKDYFLYKITYDNKIKIVELKELEKQRHSFKDEKKKSKKKLHSIKNHKKSNDYRISKQFVKHMMLQKEKGDCFMCKKGTFFKLKYSNHRLCPPCFNNNYITIIKDERSKRDLKKMFKGNHIQGV